jgi:hypothetical protein
LAVSWWHPWRLPGERALLTASSPVVSCGPGHVRIRQCLAELASAWHAGPPGSWLPDWVARWSSRSPAEGLSDPEAHVAGLSGRQRLDEQVRDRSSPKPVATRLSSGGGLREVVEAARASPQARQSPQATRAAYHGLATRFTEGYAAGQTQAQASAARLLPRRWPRRRRQPLTVDGVPRRTGSAGRRGVA